MLSRARGCVAHAVSETHQVVLDILSTLTLDWGFEYYL